MNNKKMALIWRNDLQIPLGKKMTHACHAGRAFLTEKAVYDEKTNTATIRINKDEIDWAFFGHQRTITLFVRTEEDLMIIFNKSKELGLETHLIIDAGLTVFKEPTKTCVAIGPDTDDRIDLITGENGPLGKLRLL